MEEILERQLLIRGRVIATFSTFEKVLLGFLDPLYVYRIKAFAGCMRPMGCMLCRPVLDQWIELKYLK